MFDTLIYPIAFIVALAILIAVHEFGHFWVARRMGVRVLRFSIGFGKPIWKKISKKDNTEYVIAAIPLGGYVKMLDEREGEVSEQDRRFAFNTQSVWARFAIVAAGPMFNFLFAIFALWMMYLAGVHGVTALVGDVTPDSYAERAGFRSGDHILNIDGRAASSWNQARLELLNAALDQRQAEVLVRTRSGDQRVRQLNLAGMQDPVESKDLVSDLGISRWTPPAELGRVIEGGPADRAGLQTGDVITAVNDAPVSNWLEWVRVIRANPGNTIQLEYQRHGQQYQSALKVESVERSGQQIGRSQVEMPKKYWDRLQVTIDYGPFEALQAGLQRTWDMSVLMIRVLGRIVVGQSSVSNISGPITIAQFAGSSASLGLVPFLSFLALVSISLGVLNLLPIPVLDGGHLFYYLYEMVSGKPVSEQFQATAQQFGIFLLVALMGLAFYNDILRLLG